MSETAPKIELMRSLGRLVRGLSALFWGLPLTLLVCVKTALNDWFRPFGIVPPVVATALLFYGLWQLGSFQRQERIWMKTLERTQLLGMVNIGLSPFLYWWNHLPQVSFYSAAVAIMAVTSLLFLFNLNLLLQRLAAMLPDETLRAETRLFTGVNLYLVVGILVLVAIYALLQQLSTVSGVLIYFVRLFSVVREWGFIFLVLLPLALTMTLIWKIKEVIFASVFDTVA